MPVAKHLQTRLWRNSGRFDGLPDHRLLPDLPYHYPRSTHIVHLQARCSCLTLVERDFSSKLPTELNVGRAVEDLNPVPWLGLFSSKIVTPT